MPKKKIAAKAKSKKQVVAKSKKEPLSKELYAILACPDCKKSVKYNSGKTALVCAKCKSNFPIKDSIPIMLPKGMR